MANTKLGTITHYYDKIGVGVVDVLASIKVGDKVKITGSNEFEQEITSMQIEHENIDSAKKGDQIGLKIDQSVKEGDELYKVG
ncbi:MAG TPA: translation elongation factor-like protein [Patescibacteria group bacterium]|nr:translation elongation factor-like protein [Patescibacteria group bacterium]